MSASRVPVSEATVIPGFGGIRQLVVLPNRLLHKSRPASNEMKAFGVAWYFFQY